MYGKSSTCLWLTVRVQMYDSSGVPDSLSKRTGTFFKFDSCSSLLIAKGTYDVIDLILNTVKSFWVVVFFLLSLMTGSNCM